ncbi:signal transducer and transcription activator-like [Sitodiplosis mosellana]|uniref:signal transducer and transcription activator-like n=1 Tax=Sitodiplosis mosellana TaxID=263140 RepID=UPI002443E353|nr:signal transducer and transcription activator-like [Sitodiplosis mosellana]
MPFVVPNAVSWLQMEWALSKRFEYQTGCTLTGEHLRYFYEKIFGPTPKHDPLITWKQFCKDPLPGQKFPFYHWFHDTTKLTRSHLSKEWNKGLIHGFIRKDKAEEMLRTCPAGTFLLRFSDSQLGGISVAVVNENDDGSLTLVHLQPFLISDFEIAKSHSISDLIRYIRKCTHLYPDKPKDRNFEEFYTSVNKERIKGYVRRNYNF